MYNDESEFEKGKRIEDSHRQNNFEHEEEDYCKPVRVLSFWSKNYI